MSNKSWLQDFIELLGFIIIVFLGSAVTLFVSWWIGRGVEFLSGSTTAGYATFGASGLLMMMAFMVTLVRRL